MFIESVKTLNLTSRLLDYRFTYVSNHGGSGKLESSEKWEVDEEGMYVVYRGFAFVEVSTLRLRSCDSRILVPVPLWHTDAYRLSIYLP